MIVRNYYTSYLEKNGNNLEEVVDVFIIVVLARKDWSRASPWRRNPGQNVADMPCSQDDTAQNSVLLQEEACS